MDPNTAAAVSAYASAGAAIIAAIALGVSAWLSLRAARAAELSAKKAEEGAATARAQTEIARRSSEAAERAVQASLKSVQVSSDQLLLARQEYDRAEAPQFERLDARIKHGTGMVYVPLHYADGPNSALQVSLRLSASSFSPEGEQHNYEEVFNFGMIKGFKDDFWLTLDYGKLKQGYKFSDVYLIAVFHELGVAKESARKWKDQWIVKIQGIADWMG